MARPEATTLREKGATLLALLAFLSSLLLSLAHPLDVQPLPDHRCAGHLEADPGHSTHDESRCGLCDLARTASVTAVAGAAPLTAPSLLGLVTPAPAELVFASPRSTRHPRDPPA